jgi:hypothetical protein
MITSSKSTRMISLSLFKSFSIKTLSITSLTIKVKPAKAPASTILPMSAKKRSSLYFLKLSYINLTAKILQLL